MTRAKIYVTLMFLSLLPGAALAQAKPVQTNDPVQALQKWVNDNFEFDFPYEIDQDKIQGFLDKLQERFEATSIYDLADLKAVAMRILPVLQQFEETEPYAAWLQARIDEMDAAGEMQRAMAASIPKTGNIKIVPVPPLKLQRAVWTRRVHRAPWPPLAKTYVPKLKAVFESEGVPPALVWVAGVESSFEPRARSPAGAAGMFQLMPATARAERLSLWPFDQRYQPEKSAHAAARRLRQLHQHYGGWQLALAAYNVGQGRVDHLLKEHKATTFEGIDRWLPAETQMYVPKVEATVFDREGVALTDLKSPRI